MDILSALWGYGDSLLSYVVPFLLVLTVIVFVHELGHFLVARWCGVGISVFSIGFGPEIAGFTDKHNTRWRFSWIPLGGYVKFIDDENAASAQGREAFEKLSEEDKKRSFQGKTLAQRAAIVAAGPIANFLLAIAIFTVMFSLFGQQVTAPNVDVVREGSAAEAAGFKPGDVVLEVDDTRIESFGEMQRIVSTQPGEELSFLVERDGKEIRLTATPELQEVEDRFGNKIPMGILGIQRNAGASEWTLKREDPITALGMAVNQTWFVVSHSLGYVYDVVIGRAKPDQLGGPIRIAQVSGQAASLGILAVINFAAIISISIGLINLFPIPMLDGGHLLYYAVEAIRGRPLSERSQEVGFRIGLAVVLMLMIFATWNDLIHLSFS
ncbi:Metalloprotease MmpA [Methyloligella halotolerans]|uniref:Zinc metalloprotease n=1 Tax=Methyloligella halotolerans TaxID=1177755 RepID=A0A1E2S2B8_9HYPH|nr:RIP metalloprotease RseP [Methyloligella halotolerans]ODA68489.1 Metalloprotease MmpA [Methyloligella halotolerans]